MSAINSDEDDGEDEHATIQATIAAQARTGGMGTRTTPHRGGGEDPEATALHEARRLEALRLEHPPTAEPPTAPTAPADAPPEAPSFTLDDIPPTTQEIELLRKTLRDYRQQLFAPTIPDAQPPPQAEEPLGAPTDPPPHAEEPLGAPTDQEIATLKDRLERAMVARRELRILRPEPPPGGYQTFVSDDRRTSRSDAPAGHPSQQRTPWPPPPPTELPLVGEGATPADHTTMPPPGETDIPREGPPPPVMPTLAPREAAVVASLVAAVTACTLPPAVKTQDSHDDLPRRNTPRKPPDSRPTCETPTASLSQQQGTRRWRTSTTSSSHGSDAIS